VLESCDKDTLADCVNAGDYNSLGYRLLGQGKARDGLTIFQLAVWAYPASANLQDSLADGYLAVGDTANAKKAIQRAIELATSDPSLNDSDRAGFIAAEAARLKQFQ
jgi:tetratricopeptide (TPR) repeat protein